MDRDYRRDLLKTVHRGVRENSLLKDIDREYTLSEIAIITRPDRPASLASLTRATSGPGPTPT
ncbi:MAG: hypothetical protein R3C10_21185 [Pirellulales bacterium]